MWSTNGEEPPLKQKKPSIEPNSISSLPDDLIVSCLARVSRLYYPILSLVSKRFRSLLTSSPELYQTRKLLNRTENCLYVCLQFPPNLNPRWFTLCKKPNQTLTNNNNKKKGKKSSGCGCGYGYVLAPIRILNSPNVEWPNLVSVGSNLYAISEQFENTAPCSNIFALDCRNHTWLEAPSMRIAHTDSEIDGMLYLPGSNEDTDSLKCIEVFNTETQTWNHHPGKPKRLSKLEDMEGKIYMSFDLQSDKRRLAYKPKESTWETVGLDVRWVSMCMIGRITYHYDSSVGFEWSDSKSDGRRKLKGLDGLPKFAGYSNVRLANYGGKMMVLWDKYVPARRKYKEKMIWCAEISLETRNNNGEEIWGKVDWFDAVLRVPKYYEFAYVIAATV